MRSFCNEYVRNLGEQKEYFANLITNVQRSFGELQSLRKLSKKEK